MVCFLCFFLVLLHSHLPHGWSAPLGAAGAAARQAVVAVAVAVASGRSHALFISVAAAIDSTLFVLTVAPAGVQCSLAA